MKYVNLLKYFILIKVMIKHNFPKKLFTDKGKRKIESFLKYVYIKNDFHTMYLKS